MKDSSHLGPLERAVHSRLATLGKERVSQRLWAKETQLFSDDPSKAGEIMNRLGWLSLLEPMRASLGEIGSFAAEIREQRFRDVVLLGMGGSSLCPDLLRSVFGATSPLRLHICDSTDPEAIRAIERKTDPDHTLFLVASKSGTTAEINAFTDYFFARRGSGENFVAITDPGTQLEAAAKERGFRRIFLNPPDIGGRFSALSLFGLLPAALLGIDLDAFLTGAEAMATSIQKGELNPGTWLGAVLAEGAIEGRDKLTIYAPPELFLLADWIEQLVAESTGKNGKGILPVVHEPLLEPKEYGDDRLFVFLLNPTNRTPRVMERIEALRRAKHPVIAIEVPDPISLGGEFFRWEFATAVAGSILGINPFDEPDVRKAKELTQWFLNEYEKTGSFEIEESQAPQVFEAPASGDYVALLAFLPPTEEVWNELQGLRQMIGRKHGVATTLGFGPRYLHSIGQYYKGGPKRGRFLLFTCQDTELPIPGRKYGFSVLKQAQALGDCQALKEAGRPVGRLSIRGKLLPGLRTVRAEIEKIL
ncbi:MAG: glucose-6-phosphate isomerase [Pseudomonadota bacterium]